MIAIYIWVVNYYMKAHLQLSSSKHFVIDISKLFWIAADTGKLARTGQFWRNCHIGPEKDLPNFLLIHLTNPYSVNMVKPQALHRPSHTRHSHHAGSGVGCVMYTLEGTNAPAGQQEILRETVDVRHNPQMSYYFVHTICQQI